MRRQLARIAWVFFGRQSKTMNGKKARRLDAFGLASNHMRRDLGLPEATCQRPKSRIDLWRL